MASIVEKQVNASQPKQKKQNSKDIKELGLFKTEDEMMRFFEDERLRKYHYLTYAEYIEIFGKAVDTNFLPKVNKKIIYGHLDYFNFCYDETWKYKWYPIFGTFAFNLMRFRSTSIVGTLAYLYTFDYFFENFSLHRNTNKRFIDIRNSFSYHLNKKKQSEEVIKINNLVLLNLVISSINFIYFRLLFFYFLLLFSLIYNPCWYSHKDEYKSLNVNKIQDKIVIGKNQSIQENEDIEEQKEYETFTTITNEDLQKKEENQLLAKIEKNKVYQTYQKIHHYSQLFIYNLRGGVNMNNMLDDFFKVGIYNVLNTVTKRFSQFQIEFGKYKQDIGTFPVRSDYFQLLYYKELNQNKVYNFKDQLRRIQFQNHYILQKERINESIDLYNYLIKNQITKSFVNINWIHPEHIDVNPTYSNSLFLNITLKIINQLQNIRNKWILDGLFNFLNPNLITQCFCQDNKNQNSKVQCDAQIIIKVKQIDNQLIEYLKTTKSFIIERQASKQKPATTTTTTQIKNIQKYAFIE